MVVELNSFIGHKDIGSKAKSLVDLNRYGFNVPKSIALDTSEYLNTISSIKEDIIALFDELNFQNIDEISQEIRSLFYELSLDHKMLDEVKHFMGNEKYIIRASIDSDFSFAGILPSFDTDISTIEDSIINCYASLFTYNSLYYMLLHKIDIEDIGIALILQKKIETDTYGYITTLDPVHIKTNLLMINIKKDKENENYEYDFLKEELVREDNYNLISKEHLNDVVALILELQEKFGYPLDIEIALTKNNIYVLQATELMNILCDNTYGLWEQSIDTSKIFMYSLISNDYQKIMDEYNSIYKIATSCNLLFRFNNIYCNLLDIHHLLDKVINSDNNYFYKIHMIDNRLKRKDSLLKRIGRYKNRRLHEKRINSFEDMDEKLKTFQTLYNKYCHDMSKVSSNDIENVWHTLVSEHYHLIFTSYLNLKLMNTLEKNILYSHLMKYLTIEEFNELIDVKEECYDFLCEQAFNNLVQKISDDKEAYRYWYSSSTLKILDDYNNEETSYYHPLFHHYIDTYGYLSIHPMDLSSTYYVEDVEEVIRIVKKTLANFTKLSDNKDKRIELLDKLKVALPPKKYQKIENLINRLQALLVNESIYYDYVIRFNFLVKRYTKMLAKYYLTKKTIDKESDIWHLNIDDIYNYIEGDVDSSYMKNSIKRHKLSFDSFRNYTSVSTFGNLKKEIKNAKYQGIGYSKGLIEGRIRIITSIEELHTLTPNDILVTKTLNNNLLFKLPKIKGIILSDYNLNNNVKTLLREFVLPCLYLEGCSHKLKDKSIIMMNINTGNIKVIKQ